MYSKRSALLLLVGIVLFTAASAFALPSVGDKGVTVDLSSNDISPQMIEVPEPGSLTLLGTGLVGLAGFIRRRIRG